MDASVTRSLQPFEEFFCQTWAFWVSEPNGFLENIKLLYHALA
jgi:hypothetical protein